jgi:predicted nuclease with TOPRIM domain
MSRSPQVTIRTPISTFSNRHTPSSFSNVSEGDSRNKLDELTREREDLRLRIVRQK